MSDYPMLISNKLHSFRNFCMQIYEFFIKCIEKLCFFCLYEFIFEFLNAKRDAAHAASLF